mmetsp:Transcript_11071/g.21141  ORF Transcript_11071/g.21141 Transcript_11071/m.21141 type:complete len:405 (-) Transcript_11071:23-1237(-)
MAPTKELPYVDEESALEEQSPSVTKPNNRLSVISQKYDIDGDGKLDAAEQAMRDMDQSGRGFLTNEKVYEVVQQQMAMQKQMFNMKKILIGLSVFTVVLALSNLATAWAAAVLAKETTVDASGHMKTKAGDKDVSVQANAEVFDAVRKESDRRELDLYEETSETVPIAIKSELESCTAVAIRIRHVCLPDNVVRFYRYDCDNNIESGNGGNLSFTDGIVTVNSCNNGAGTCVITGLPCSDFTEPANGDPSSVEANALAPGEECYIDEECQAGSSCVDDSTSVTGKKCKVPEGSSCTDGAHCTTGLCDTPNTSKCVAAPTCAHNGGADSYSNASCDPSHPDFTSPCLHTYACCNSQTPDEITCSCDNGEYMCAMVGQSPDCAYPDLDTSTWQCSGQISVPPPTSP